jgi:hypothetical protein
MPPSRAHREADMPIRTRTEFPNQEDWTAYVRDCVPVVEREYVLACGRTQLFKSFYEVRKQNFPVEYARELERIQALSEPDRTESLERLNDRIFASLTELLLHSAPPKQIEGAPPASTSPREQVQDLLNHLAEKNPYFALWIDYKRQCAESVEAKDWDCFLSKELGPEDGDAITFSKAMADLDKVLCYFRDRNLSLPRYFFERAWFLHYLRGPERMLQTRALLNTLAMESGECTSA